VFGTGLPSTDSTDSATRARFPSQAIGTATGARKLAGYPPANGLWTGNGNGVWMAPVDRYNSSAAPVPEYSRLWEINTSGTAVCGKAGFGCSIQTAAAPTKARTSFWLRGNPERRRLLVTGMVTARAKSATPEWLDHGLQRNGSWNGTGPQWEIVSAASVAILVKRPSRASGIPLPPRSDVRDRSPPVPSHQVKSGMGFRLLFQRSTIAMNPC